MNFHSTSQPYMRPVIQIGVGQRSLRQGKGNFAHNFVFWRPVGKILFMLVSFVLVVNMYVASSISKTDQLITLADNKRHELMDKNIALRATKARLRKDEQIQQSAAEKLSLYLHTKGQVGKFNYQTGDFIYL